MTLDHAEVEPNVARDRRIKLPREDREEVDPPSADAVEAVLSACAPRYRLPLLLLDATGLRVSELENLRWGDLDEPTGRFRISKATIKTRRSLWADVPPDLFGAVLARVPREDREPTAPVFPELTQARLRTDIARACRATGTPLWAPTTCATGACRCGTWRGARSRRWPGGSASAGCRRPWTVLPCGP